MATTDSEIKVNVTLGDFTHHDALTVIDAA